MDRTMQRPEYRPDEGGFSRPEANSFLPQQAALDATLIDLLSTATYATPKEYFQPTPERTLVLAGNLPEHISAAAANSRPRAHGAIVMGASRLPPKPDFEAFDASAPASAARRPFILALIGNLDSSRTNNESLFIYVLMI